MHDQIAQGGRRLKKAKRGGYGPAIAGLNEPQQAMGRIETEPRRFRCTQFGGYGSGGCPELGIPAKGYLRLFANQLWQWDVRHGPRDNDQIRVVEEQVPLAAFGLCKRRAVNREIAKTGPQTLLDPR